MLARILYLPIILALFACGNQDTAWQMAERDDTPATYLEFLAKYPNSEYATKARARMEALKVIHAWERAEFKNNEADYSAFIAKYPDSEFVAQAQSRIADLARDAEWAVVKEAESVEVVEAFLRHYPDAPQIGEARELLATLEKIREAEKPAERPGDFRLQLAAFRTAQAAEEEVRRLVALFPETLMGPLRVEASAEDGPSRRFILKSVPMSSSEAQAACETLKRYGQNCLIINR